MYAKKNPHFKTKVFTQLFFFFMAFAEGHFLINTQPYFSPKPLNQYEP